MPADRVRVLVTGAGGPAGVAVIRSLQRDPAVELVAADMDPYAAGLYLVDPARRWLVPAGDARGFAGELLARCRTDRIDVVIPTVDVELLPLAVTRTGFADAGVRLALTSEAALRCTLDKLALARACSPTVHTPRTEALTTATAAYPWTYPVIVKPRSGSGSRGIRTVASDPELRELCGDGALIVQEFLPGEEFSLDVLADPAGRVVSVVPRARLRVDSGVSVAGRTLHDPELDALARGVVRAVGLTLVGNVQCRRDAAGRAALLEVNPRFPGALPLTIHSGVDLPRLCLDAVLGRPLPASVPHTERLMVRFLDERFPDPAELLALDREVLV
jgi:carbamoyl-phosphate synthase large subunit